MPVLVAPPEAFLAPGTRKSDFFLFQGTQNSEQIWANHSGENSAECLLKEPRPRLPRVLAYRASSSSIGKKKNPSLG